MLVFYTEDIEKNIEIQVLKYVFIILLKLKLYFHEKLKDFRYPYVYQEFMMYA